MGSEMGKRDRPSPGDPPPPPQSGEKIYPWMLSPPVTPPPSVSRSPSLCARSGRSRASPMMSVALSLSVLSLVGPLGPRAGAPQLGVRPAARVARPAHAIRMQFGRGADSASSEPSEELVAAFRMLGIAEDATYDEVESAYAELLERYKGQTKQTIKLQVAKDKILDFRLRQRMSGALRPDRKFGALLRTRLAGVERDSQAWNATRRRGPRRAGPSANAGAVRAFAYHSTPYGTNRAPYLVARWIHHWRPVALGAHPLHLRIIQVRTSDQPSPKSP